MKATRFFTALALVFSAAVPNAFDVTPPPVPDNLQVPAGNRAFLITHAVGTQSYICLPAGNKVEWTFVGPQATLFDDQSEQVLTHFLSPNPDESGLPRPTWQHSRDTSAVWAQRVDSAPAPIAGAIPWLLLEIVGEEDGPTGGDKVTRTDLHSASEHDRRRGSGDRVQGAEGSLQDDVRAVHLRLRLLSGGH